MSWKSKAVRDQPGQCCSNSSGGGGLTLVVSEVKRDLGVVCEGDKEKSSAVENQYFSPLVFVLESGTI